MEHIYPFFFSMTRSVRAAVYRLCPSKNRLKYICRCPSFLDVGVSSGRLSEPELKNDSVEEGGVGRLQKNPAVVNPISTQKTTNVCKTTLPLGSSSYFRRTLPPSPQTQGYHHHPCKMGRRDPSRTLFQRPKHLRMVAQPARTISPG